MGIAQLWRRVLRVFGLGPAPTRLDRAQELLGQGHIEEAIFACRDSLFATLIDLARAARLGMPRGDQDERAYALNDSLAEMGVYAQPMQRQIQGWLQMGQLALEGATDQITIGDVQELINGLGSFNRVVSVTLEAAGLTHSDAISSPATPMPRVAPPPQVAPRRPAAPPQQPRMAPPQPRPRELTAPGMSQIPLGSDQAPAALGTMPRVPGFVGRGHTVMRLASLLRQGRHVALVPLQAGTSGVGLSALASETLWVLEQDRPPSFPDGIIAMHGFGRQGEEGLRWIYNEIGASWKVPAIAQAPSIGVQEREIRRLLVGRRVLIVLDFIELGLPIQRLMDTLASTGAVVLITSRFVPSAEQLSVLRLDPLGPAPALTLAQNRFAAARGDMATWDEDAARTMCALLDHRPLAIELAAAFAATTPTTIAGLAQRLDIAQHRGLLADRADPNQSLRYLIDLVTQALDPPTQHRFAALAIFAGSTWGEDAALAVMNAIELPDLQMNASASVPPADETLRLLVRRSLVQAVPSSAGPLRYRLQPLLRGIAGRILLDRPVVTDWAGHAMSAYFAGLALTKRKAADNEVMREEYTHMEAGLIWAHAHNEPEIVVSYGMGLYRFWQRQGLWREAEGYLRWTIESAHAIGDRPREATLAEALATLYASMTKRSRALEWFEHALIIWRDLGNARNEGSTLFELGRLAQSDEDSENARVYYEASLGAAKEAADEQGQGRALQALGLIAESQGQVEQARRYYELVFGMRQAAQDVVGQAGALNVLGVLEYRLGNFPAARDHLLASLQCALDGKNEFWEAEARFWLGETSVGLGNQRDAVEQWQRALTLYVRQGRTRDAEETQRRLNRLIGPPVS